MGAAATWALVSFITTLVALPPLLRALGRLGTVDVANHRSSHEGAVLRGAGVAITLGFVVGLAASHQGGSAGVAIATLAATLTAVGFWDDLHNLAPAPRLVGLLVAGGILALVVPLEPHPVIGCGLAALWVASTVNAYNFMDGINGISSLTAMVAGASFVVMGVTTDNGLLTALGACSLGAAAAFLPFNAPRARAFMGDAGSYGLGFVVGASAWTAWLSGIPIWVALAPLSIYLIDTASTLVMRARQNKPLTEAHREHVYQGLVQAGMTHTQSALLVAAGAATVFALSYASWRLDMPFIGMTIWLVVALGYGVGVRRLAAKSRALVQSE